MTRLIKLLFQMVALHFHERCTFEGRLEREIYMGMFPHLNNERDNGYPFHSDEEFRAVLRREGRSLRADLDLLEQQCEAMPRAYGEAFRYLLYRDVRRAMARYQTFAPERIYLKRERDPRLLATQA